MLLGKLLQRLKNESIYITLSLTLLCNIVGCILSFRTFASHVEKGKVW